MEREELRNIVEADYIHMCNEEIAKYATFFKERLRVEPDTVRKITADDHLTKWHLGFDDRIATLDGEIFLITSHNSDWDVYYRLRQLVKRKNWRGKSVIRLKHIYRLADVEVR